MKLTLFVVAKNKKFDIEVDEENDYIFTIKNKLIETYIEDNIEVSQIKLIHAGKVLNNSEKIKDSKIKNDNTIHCVISKKEQQEQMETIQPSPVLPNPWTSNPNSTAPNQMNSLFNSPMMQQMTQQLMNNPQMIQQMMSNPMMQQMMSNNSMMNNPRVAELISDPARFQQTLNDPMTQYMMNNPGCMEAMMSSMNYRNSTQTQPPNQTPTQVTTSNPVSDEELYKNQLIQLEELGFLDKMQNINALKQCGGDINGAITFLVGMN